MRKTQIALTLLQLSGSIGCGTSSPSRPSLLTPPAASTAAATSQKAPFTVSPTAGLVGEEISILATGFVRGVTVKLDGIEAHVVAVHPAGTTVYVTTPEHAPGVVDVVVSNPGSPSLTLIGGYTFVPADAFSVSASPNLVTAGGQLKISWVAPEGRGCNGGGDWVAIFKIGDPDVTGAKNGHSDLWYDHLCGAAHGTLSLKAPAEPGLYEFRFMVGDTSVARSNPVAIEKES